MDTFAVLLVLAMTVSSLFIIHLPEPYAIGQYLFIAIVCALAIGVIAQSLLARSLWQKRLQLRLPCEFEQNVAIQGGRPGQNVLIYFSCSPALINGSVSVNASGVNLTQLQLPKRDPYWLKVKFPSIGRFYNGRVFSLFNYKIFNRRPYAPLQISLKIIGSPSEFRLLFKLHKTLNDDEQKRIVPDWTDEQHVELSIE